MRNILERFQKMNKNEMELMFAVLGLLNLCNKMPDIMSYMLGDNDKFLKERMSKKREGVK